MSSPFRSLVTRPKRDPKPRWKRNAGGWYFYAEVYDPTRRPSRKWVASGIYGGTGAQPTAKAEGYAAEWLTDLTRAWRHGDVDPWEGLRDRVDAGYAEAVERYFASNSQLRSTTAATRRSVLDAFGATFPAGLSLSYVDAGHVERFLARPSRRSNAPLSLSTRHGYLGALRYFFAWCVREGLLRADPSVAVKLRPLGRRLPEFLTPREFERLETAAEDLRAEIAATARGRIRDRDVVWILDPVRLALATGLRISDVCRLEWSRVRREAGVILVDERTKSGNEYAVPILRLAGEVLDRQAEEYAAMGMTDGLVFHSPYPDRGYGHAGRYGGGWRPLSRDNLQSVFRAVRGHAKLPEAVSFHTLRHTFATWILMQTGNLRLVSALLGHASTAQTERYAHVALLAQRQISAEEFGRLGVSWAEYAGEGSALALTAAHRTP